MGHTVATVSRRTAFIVALAMGVCVTPTSAEPRAWELGARIGGYGFRDGEAPGYDVDGWDTCRMNGVGVFADWGLAERLHIEVGLDGYFSDRTSLAAGDGASASPAAGWHVERTSGLLSAAVSAYPWRGKRLASMLQIGSGVELTKVDVTGAKDATTAVAPLGFVGAGGDLKVSPKVRIGMSLRLHAMKLMTPVGWNGELDQEVALATQMQFFVKAALR